MICRFLIWRVIGAGKGTQSEILSANYGYIHLSTGDMCREAVLLNNELGKKVQPYINDGKLVPDGLMTDIICARLQQEDAKTKGVLLDGYPRTAKQSFDLSTNNYVEIDRVILIQVLDEMCIQRVLGKSMF